MSADNYYIVRRHPLGGYTYVMGFASDVDEDGFEIIPDATESDPRFNTKDEAMSACVHKYAEYGHTYHPETCDKHDILYVSCDTCGDMDEYCKSCDYSKGHI